MIPGMLITSRAYQKAMEVIGSTVTFVEPAPLLTKRKATEDGSPRPLKSLKVDSVRIDNTFVEQFIGGAFSSSYLNLVLIAFFRVS